MNTTVKIELIVATPAQMAAGFTEWMRRYQANPEKFFSEQQTLAQDAKTYGETSLPYFLKCMKAAKRNPVTPRRKCDARSRSRPARRRLAKRLAKA